MMEPCAATATQHSRTSLHAGTCNAVPHTLYTLHAAASCAALSLGRRQGCTAHEPVPAASSAAGRFPSQPTHYPSVAALAALRVPPQVHEAFEILMDVLASSDVLVIVSSPAVLCSSASRHTVC